jgi:hypothetical protein
MLSVSTLIVVASLSASSAQTNACAVPAVPTVIDCRDPEMSFWLGEMIGSCDMPKPSPTTGAPTSIAAGSAASSRICDGLRCSHEAIPLFAASLAPDDGAPLGLEQARFRVWLTTTPIASGADSLVARLCDGRLERPPRA